MLTDFAQTIRLKYLKAFANVIPPPWRNYRHGELKRPFSSLCTSRKLPDKAMIWWTKQQHSRLDRSGKHSPASKTRAEVAELAVKKDKRFVSKNSKKQLVYARRTSQTTSENASEVEAKQNSSQPSQMKISAEVVSQWTGIPLKQMEKKRKRTSRSSWKIAPTCDWTRGSRISGSSFNSPCSYELKDQTSIGSFLFMDLLGLVRQSAWPIGSVGTKDTYVSICPSTCGETRG